MGNFMGLDSQFWGSLVADPLSILVNSLDILIVAWLIYRFIKALAGTKIMSLVQGVILFVLLRVIAELLGFTTISYLMNQVITYGVIAGVVIFAPEIRSGLERFGRTTQVFLQTQQTSEEDRLIEALVTSVAYMSPRRIGALVSIEQSQTLQEYMATGIALDADISSQLLINIFIPNTPLHDGAVMIKGKKIVASCCYLPLSESTSISKEFGTRHRAAIGLSEQSDALSLIVSEETGAISLAYKSRFYHDLSTNDLEKHLREILQTTAEAKVPLRRRWFGGKDHA